MCIRSLCFLPLLVICTVVGRKQSDLMHNSKATACYNFISIYPNLFEFLVNLFEFYRGFWVNLSEKRGCVKSWTMCQHHHFPHWSRILVLVLDKVFIQASGLACEVYVEVSPLRSLPTTVCEIKVCLISVILCYWVCVLVNLLCIFFLQ